MAAKYTIASHEIAEEYPALLIKEREVDVCDALLTWRSTNLRKTED